MPSRRPARPVGMVACSRPGGAARCKGGEASTRPRARRDAAGAAARRKTGDAGAWGRRPEQGFDTLVKHAVEGFKRSCPPKAATRSRPDRGCPRRRVHGQPVGRQVHRAPRRLPPPRSRPPARPDTLRGTDRQAGLQRLAMTRARAAHRGSATVPRGPSACRTGSTRSRTRRFTATPACRRAAAWKPHRSRDEGRGALHVQCQRWCGGRGQRAGRSTRDWRFSTAGREPRRRRASPYGAKVYAAAATPATRPAWAGAPKFATRPRGLRAPRWESPR